MQLEANPNDAGAWVEAAHALGDAGAFAEAVDAWRRATDLLPSHPTPWLGLGRALAARGARDEPGACYRRAVVADATNVDARLALGLWLMHRGEFGEAELCLAEVTRTAPERSDGLGAHALCLHRLGRDEHAWQVLRRATACPVSAIAAAEMARDHTERVLAREWVQKALEGAPDDPLLLHHHAAKLHPLVQ